MDILNEEEFEKLPLDEAQDYVLNLFKELSEEEQEEIYNKLIIKFSELGIEL